jgi:hypothetical protein
MSSSQIPQIPQIPWLTQPWCFPNAVTIFTNSNGTVPLDANKWELCLDFEGGYKQLVYNEAFLNSKKLPIPAASNGQSGNYVYKLSGGPEISNAVSIFRNGDFDQSLNFSIRLLKKGTQNGSGVLFQKSTLRFSGTNTVYGEDITQDVEFSGEPTMFSAVEWQSPGRKSPSRARFPSDVSSTLGPVWFNFNHTSRPVLKLWLNPPNA